MTQDRPFSVFTALPSYIAAVAELPASAALAPAMNGAVAVVPGSGDWWQGLLAARAGGAAAVVLACPGALPPGALAAHPWPRDVPVIVERPRLRPDVVADALRGRSGSQALMVAVECAAPAAGLDAVIRDGFGWARSLAPGPLTLPACIATAQGGMALLESDGGDGRPVHLTLVGTPVGGLHPGGLLKVLALGEVRTELTVDEPAGFTRLETATADGALRAPERFESSARLALRRAIQACASGDPVPDLDELLGDLALTNALLGNQPAPASDV